MDPEIVKTATELAKATGTAAGLSIPFTGIVKRMLGPAADEVAEMWRDQVRLYRYERQVKLLEKVEKIAKDGNLTLGPVPPKILFPLLEGASFEDDENLHDMWAALLANAASPEATGKVRPGFLAILKQMAPDEAALLKALAEVTDEYAKVLQTSTRPTKAALDLYISEHTRRLSDQVRKAFIALPGETEEDEDIRFQTCIQALSNVGLVGLSGEFTIVSVFGRIFLEVCRPPKPKGKHGPKRTAEDRSRTQEDR